MTMMMIYHFNMKIYIPSSVDVKSLVSELNLSDTKAKNLKQRLYFVLSRIVVHNDNIHLFQNQEYYRTICSKQIKQIVGTRYYYQIMKLLMDSEKPIIESNSSYQRGKFCKQFRLTQKYNSGEIEFKTLPDNSSLVKRINKVYPSIFEADLMLKKYQFLVNQFDQNKLTFDVKIYQFILQLYVHLRNRINKNNQYQIQVLEDIVGRFLYYIDKVNNGVYNPIVSAKNHRLNSVFTQIPKILRPYILCNNESIIGVDIKSCQPYLLSTIMTNKFFKNNKEGFNLKTIYYNLYNDLNKRGYLNDINTNSFYNINSNINYDIINKEYSPFMWCKNFSEYQIKNIKDFQNIPFEKDYYQYVVMKNSNSTFSIDEINKKRESFKKSSMYILFDDNFLNRTHNDSIKLMKKNFPGVNKWIEATLEVIGSREFSYVLQRSESYFLLEKVARRFNEIYPTAPIFSIHDSLFTSKEFISELKVLMKNMGRSELNVIPGLKIDNNLVQDNKLESIVEKYWKKIKWVNTPKRFESKKRGIFNSNINRTKKFLKNYSAAA